MSDQTTPLRLNLKKDEKLDIEWADGHRSTYSMSYLRSICPCASCKVVREDQPSTVGKKPLLRVLPGNWAEEIHAESAELVGNYALRIDWSDKHGTGIYSFQYLRSKCQQESGAK